MLCYGIGMPIAGHLISTRGTRFVLLLGAVLVMIAIIWTVQASGPISFLLSFGVLLSLGLAFISPVSMTPMLSRWFIRRRGMALFFLRSEEHTSELQSLMRISYAVFCLKNKKKNKKN